MYRSSKRIIAFILLSVIVLGAVFASYRIVDYDFMIDGSTKKWALSNRVKGSDEVFETQEALEAALDAKRQILWNTNVFTSVKCSWEEVQTVGDTTDVIAVIEVADSGSYIILPYPKYDSNTGFSLGLRYKNNNVLGTLGTAAVSVDWVQNGTGFDASTFEFEVPFENILLSNGSSLYFDITGNYNLADPDDGKIDFSTGINNFKISDVTLDGSLGISYVYEGNTFDKLTGSLSAKGFNVGGIYLDASASALLNYKSDIDDSNIVTALSLRKIEIGRLSIADTLTYTLAPSDNVDIRSLTSAKLINATTFGIQSDKIKDLVVGTEGGFNFAEDYQYLTVSFAFSPVEKITSTTSVTGNNSDDHGFYALKVSQSFSSSLKILNDKLTVTPTVTLINKNGSDYDLSPRAWELDSSIIVSGGDINRVSSGETYFAFRDNFRKGIKTEAQAMLLWNMDQEADFIIRGAATAFFHPLKNFNPSFRVYAAAAVDPIDWFNQADGSTYANANTYSFFDYTMTKETLNSLVRGVRLDSDKIQNAPKTNYMGYFSMNLTSSFLYFEDFGHLYVSPFLDAALFTNNIANSYELVSGVGVEAFMIMDSHASYPIRVSVGFDLEDLVDKFKGKDVSLGYEIFVGLGFLY